MDGYSPINDHDGVERLARGLDVIGDFPIRELVFVCIFVAKAETWQDISIHGPRVYDQNVRWLAVVIYSESVAGSIRDSFGERVSFRKNGIICLVSLP